MNAVQLNRKFLKKPFYSIGILLIIVLVMEGLSWSSVYSAKLAILNRYGGLWPYISIFLRSAIIPEVSTIYILLTLINVYHTRFNVTSVDLNARAIGQYELQLLPTVFCSFLAFNPVTETVRFLGEQFPSYSPAIYWNDYILGTFTWAIFVRYLIPIILIGYLAINVSLINDYLQQRQQEQADADSQPDQVAGQAGAVNKSSPLPAYLSHLKGKNAHGELNFPVSDVYFFTIEDRFYYAELDKGRYLVGKTLNDLETELDPTQFMRIKRDYIVNRQAVLTYAYWENGKYIVRLNTPDHHEIVVPRARMQEFKEWLQNRNSNTSTAPPTGPLALVD